MINNINPNMSPPRQGVQQPKFGLLDTSAVVCKCGNNTFYEGFMLRKVSKIVTGEDRDSLVNLPVPVCTKCNSKLPEFLPVELQEKV